MMHKAESMRKNVNTNGYDGGSWIFTNQGALSLKQTEGVAKGGSRQLRVAKGTLKGPVSENRSKRKRP